jgi:hypothetical protein
VGILNTYARGNKMIVKYLNWLATWGYSHSDNSLSDFKNEFGILDKQMIELNGVIEYV